MRHRISLIGFLLGAALLWPLPIGAAVLMVVATFALVISWEEQLDQPVPAPVRARPPTTISGEPSGR